MVSVCLTVHSPASAVCSGFAAVDVPGRRYQSIAAWPVPQHGAQLTDDGR